MKNLQLFSETVITAMNLYSDCHDDLKDSESTQRFSERVNNLNNAMMSRTVKDTLRDDSAKYNVSIL